MQPIGSPEDKDILDAAMEVCRKLGLTDYRLQAISWVPRMYSSFQASRFSLLPSDQVVIRQGFMVLAWPLKGRLSAEEWKPLIASSLIYDRVLSRKRAMGLLTRLLVPLALIIPLFISLVAAATPLLPRWANILGGIISILLVPLIIASAVLLGASYRRSLRLKADTLSAQQFPREEFSQTLQKIDQLNIPDILQLKHHKSRLRIFQAPSISQRIENLQTTSSLGQGFGSIALLSFIGAGLTLLGGAVGLLVDLPSPTLADLILGGVGIPCGIIILLSGITILTQPGPRKTLPRILIFFSLAYWVAFAAGTILTTGGDLGSSIEGALFDGLVGPVEGIAAGILLSRRTQN